MDNVTSAIFRHVYANVPNVILKEAFIPKDTRLPNTLDFYIRDKVILGRVLPDCNIFGGKLAKLILEPEYIEYTDPTDVMMASQTIMSGVYRIPPDKREHRNISHVIDLTYPYASNDFRSITSSARTVGALGIDLVRSYTYEDTYVIPRAILLSGDLIKLLPLQVTHISWVANVQLEYDEYFTNLNRSAIFPLMELVLVAVQAHIYNELIIKIDNAYIVGGQELTTIKEQVERYADANEKYQEKLLSFRGGQALDPEVLAETLKMMFD